MASGHNRLGIVLDKLGEVDAALKHYLADLKIRRELVARQPDNFALKRSYQVALSSWVERTKIAVISTRPPSTTGCGVKWRSASAAADPRNANWRRDEAAAESTLAGALRLMGRLREAERAYERAIAIIRPIAEASPTQATRQRDLADAELGLGLTYFERGELDAAAARADVVERLLAPLLARGTDREATRRAAEGRLLAADVAARRGNARLAQQLREAALALVASGQETNPEKRLLAVQARALLALNRTAKPARSSNGLLSLGYRHPTLMRSVPPHTEAPVTEKRLAGTKLGSYEVNGLLGKGGMGEVYRARDTPRNARSVISCASGRCATWQLWSSGKFVSPDGQRFLINSLAEEVAAPITVLLNWKARP